MISLEGFRLRIKRNHQEILLLVPQKEASQRGPLISQKATSRKGSHYPVNLKRIQVKCRDQSAKMDLHSSQTKARRRPMPKEKKNTMNQQLIKTISETGNRFC